MADRPIDPRLSPQDQAQYLTETGNGPTSSDEAAVLEAEFGAPDTHGVYGAPTTQSGGE